MSSSPSQRSRIVLYAVIGALAAALSAVIGGGTVARFVVTAVGVMVLLTLVEVARSRWSRGA
jgi:uncharacterized membrane protein YczE